MRKNIVSFSVIVSLFVLSIWGMNFGCQRHSSRQSITAPQPAAPLLLHLTNAKAVSLTVTAQSSEAGGANSSQSFSAPTFPLNLNLTLTIPPCNYTITATSVLEDGSSDTASVGVDACNFGGAPITLAVVTEIAPTPTPTIAANSTATPIVAEIPTETPVATVTGTVTATPTGVPTDTPIPTATPTDTPVPTATPTDTPVPTATPIPSTITIDFVCASGGTMTLTATSAVSQDTMVGIDCPFSPPVIQSLATGTSSTSGLTCTDTETCTPGPFLTTDGSGAAIVAGPGCTCIPAPTPTPTSPCNGTKVFLFTTATSFSANLGGISGADTKCQTDTNAPAGCTIKAVISDSTPYHAKDVLPVGSQTLPVYRLDGATQIVTVWANLWNGTSTVLLNSISATSGNFWSGTDKNGAYDASLPYTMCDNWTTTADAYSGGDATRNDEWWASATTGVCSAGSNYLVCVAY